MGCSLSFYMKNLASLLVILFAFTPSISFAAPLTQAQADSLINVVKSSPSTPASAFTDLITAFSHITLAQAESLIGVIQAAPGTPTSSFENLLIAFTQDTLVATTTASGTTQITVTTTTTTTSASPSVIAPTKDTISPTITSFEIRLNNHMLFWIEADEALDIAKTEFRVEVPDGPGMTQNASGYRYNCDTSKGDCYTYKLLPITISNITGGYNPNVMDFQSKTGKIYEYTTTITDPVQAAIDAGYVTTNRPTIQLKVFDLAGNKAVIVQSHW